MIRRSRAPARAAGRPSGSPSPPPPRSALWSSPGGAAGRGRRKGGAGGPLAPLLARVGLGAGAGSSGQEEEGVGRGGAPLPASPAREGPVVSLSVDVRGPRDPGNSPTGQAIVRALNFRVAET